MGEGAQCNDEDGRRDRRGDGRGNVEENLKLVRSHRVQSRPSFSGRSRAYRKDRLSTLSLTGKLERTTFISINVKRRREVDRFHTTSWCSIGRRLRRTVHEGTGRLLELSEGEREVRHQYLRVKTFNTQSYHRGHGTSYHYISVFTPSTSGLALERSSVAIAERSGRKSLIKVDHE